ncbi:MAG: flagellar hook-length control protein FliK [Alphaproteobacteria bacterium]|nr:flagellar hook-length control protein FliK [Alphaproteobacteria bacterium]
MELVQALSVSTTGSNSLGDAIAGDRLLISGQNSAIFDLAMLAPGLITPDSANEIAITSPLPIDVVSVAETSSFGFDPVEMPTEEGNSIAPVAIETPLKAFSFSGGPLPEASLENSDAALTQALTALTALEQTGRSSLIPQKARPDLLPSILTARLGFETPRIDKVSIAPEQADPLAPIFTFPSSPEGEAGEPKPFDFERGASVTNLETVEMQDFTLNIVAVPAPANEHESVSIQAVEFDLVSTIDSGNQSLSSKTGPFVVADKTQSNTNATHTESELESFSTIHAVSIDQISTITATSQEIPSPSMEYRTVFSALTKEGQVPAAQATIVGVVSRDAIKAPSDVITVNTDSSDQTPAIEEARRDERPSFIGELIETPKPIILPNQPMPVAPRAPLSDPVPASHNTAFVFGNEPRIEASEMSSRNIEGQEQDLLPIINRDHEGVAAPVDVENSAPLIPFEDVNVKTDSARSQRAFLSTVVPNDFVTEEVLNPEAKKALDLKSLSNVETDIVIDIDRSIDKPVAHDLVKPLRIGQGAINNDNSETIKTSIAPEKQTLKVTKQEDETFDPVSPALLNDQASVLNISFVNAIVPPLVVSAHLQDTLEATDQESAGTGSGAKKFISTAPSNLSVTNQIGLQTSPKINVDAMDETEKFAAQQILDSGIVGETALAIMGAPIKASIKDTDKSELKNATVSGSKESSILKDLLPSTSQTPYFTGEETSPDQNNSGHQPRHEESFINQKPNIDENLFKSISKEDFEATKLVAANPSIIDETVKAKLSTEISVSISPTQTEAVDILPLATGDLDKKAIDAVALNKSVVDSIRDMTAMVSHSDTVDHRIATSVGYAPSSPSYDYRSGYAAPQGASVPENTAAPGYAASDNPLFQIQRDRAVEAQVIAALKAGRNEVRLSLYPPQLGQVTINLALDGQKVKVALKTSSREATELLTSEQPSLTHALQREGFSLEGFDVTEDGPHDNRKDESDQTIISPVPASSGSSEFSIDITI